jgi:hypothetical protein
MKNLSQSSVRLSAYLGVATTGHISVNFDVRDFNENLSTKIHNLLKSGKTSGHFI